jgi:hypothetical protein
MQLHPLFRQRAVKFPVLREFGMQEQVTPELLARIAAAFGEHRLDDVVDLFAEDGAFINARGSLRVVLG